MERRENPRAEQTRHRIRQALIRLLETEDIRKISIKELCALAGINRTTFYLHYASQYEVLSQIREGYLRDIARAIESARLQDREELLSRVSLVFDYMQENLQISRLLIRNNDDGEFAEELFSLPKIEALLSQSLAQCPDPEYRRDITTFTVSGAYRLVQDWVAAEQRRSPREMAILVLQLAEAVCASRPGEETI